MPQGLVSAEVENGVYGFRISKGMLDLRRY
jgi:hypothetical protein